MAIASMFRRQPPQPGAPMVSFVPRAIQVTAFGDASPDSDLVLGHRLALDGVGRLDGGWAGLVAANPMPVPRDFPRPGKMIAAFAELVVDWDDYWDETASLFTGVARDSASISAAARDAAAAVSYTARQGGPGLVLALRVRGETMGQLQPWWRLGIQVRAARLAVNVTGLRFARAGVTPASGYGTSLPDFSLGVPVFADAYGFAAQIPSRRP